MRHNGPDGNGNNIVYTVLVNGVATSLAVTLASTSSQGSNTSNTVAVTAGDIIDIQITKSSSIVTSPDDVIASLELAA